MSTLDRSRCLRIMFAVVMFVTVGASATARAQKPRQPLPPGVAARLPITYTFPVATMPWKKTATAKTTFADHGREGRLTFAATWPMAPTPDAEGAFDARLKIVVHSEDGLRGEATGYSQNSAKTPKLLITVDATRAQVARTWIAEITAADTFPGTLSNIQVKASIR